MDLVANKCHMCRLCVIYVFSEVFTVEIVSMLNLRNQLGLITLATTCKIAKYLCWYAPLVGRACETNARSNTHGLKLIQICFEPCTLQSYMPVHNHVIDRRSESAAEIYLAHYKRPSFLCLFETFNNKLK